MKLTLYARAIIADNGALLVNRHGDDIRFFGGRVGSKETLREALHRELEEELTLPIDVFEPLFVHDDIEKKARTVTVYYDARVLSNTPRLIEACEPHLEPHWLSVHDIAFDGIKPKRLRALLQRTYQPFRQRTVK